VKSTSVTILYFFYFYFSQRALLVLYFLVYCYYANTFHEDIRENYAIKEICRRLQAMQAIT